MQYREFNNERPAILPALMLGLWVHALCILAATATAAQPNPKVLIERGKNAVGCLGGFADAPHATAVCVDPRGLFLTAASAIPPTPRALDLRIGVGETARTFKAVVVRLDRAAGLALLKTLQPFESASLPLGDADELVETLPLTAYGFPAQGAADAPIVSVRIAHIASLARKSARLFSMGIDIELDPGWRGGPVLDAEGRLVGLLDIADGRVNRAIALPVIGAFLERPEIIAPDWKVAHAHRHEIRDWRLAIATFGRTDPLSVELTLGTDGESSPRRIAGVAAGQGGWAFRFAPIPQRIGPVKLPASILYPAGRVEATIEDVDIRLDQKSFRLADVSRVERRARTAEVLLRDGTRHTGAVLHVPALRTDLGGYVLELDTFKASRIDVGAPPAEPDVVEYTLSVRRDQTVVAQVASAIAVAGAGASGRSVDAGGTADGLLAVDVATPPPGDVQIHVCPRGTLKPLQGDPEFNIPRADEPAADPAIPAVLLRVVNRGSRPIAELRLKVELAVPAGRPQSRTVDLLGPSRLLKPGEVLSRSVAFEQAWQRTHGHGRVKVEIVDVRAELK